jgi:hypothetical protein
MTVRSELLCITIETVLKEIEEKEDYEMKIEHIKLICEKLLYYQYTGK